MIELQTSAHTYVPNRKSKGKHNTKSGSKDDSSSEDEGDFSADAPEEETCEVRPDIFMNHLDERELFITKDADKINQTDSYEMIVNAPRVMASAGRCDPNPRQCQPEHAHQFNIVPTPYAAYSVRVDARCRRSRRNSQTAITVLFPLFYLGTCRPSMTQRRSTARSTLSRGILKTGQQPDHHHICSVGGYRRLGVHERFQCRGGGSRP